MPSEVLVRSFKKLLGINPNNVGVGSFYMGNASDPDPGNYGDPDPRHIYLAGKQLPNSA
jgi:hypothetical protein